ncbi:MAG: hypothetical protein JWP41_1825 [Ramlibacter sp.]|jgi:hypothetical protein|nr:hypothetical protein [Ramlibacter sp.]
MSKALRERRHQANLRKIQAVQRIAGTGDTARIDHEGTVLERARLMMDEISSHQATERGLQALDRLLRFMERNDSQQARDVVRFIDAIWNNHPLPLMTLRGLDQSVGDDMLAVLDAWRYARLNLIEHAEGGPARVGAMLKKRSLADA